MDDAMRTGWLFALSACVGVSRLTTTACRLKTRSNQTGRGLDHFVLIYDTRFCL